MFCSVDTPLSTCAQGDGQVCPHTLNLTTMEPAELERIMLHMEQENTIKEVNKAEIDKVED